MVSHRVFTDLGDGSEKKEDAASAGTITASRTPRRNFLAACLSHFGLASLGYLLGASVIFFELPTSDFLRRAFVGGVAWYKQNQPLPPPVEQPPTIKTQIDKPEKRYDGYTLCMRAGGPRAELINMHSEPVHQWYTPLKTVLQDLQPGFSAPVRESEVCYNDGHIFPNGDLLVLVEGPGNVRRLVMSYGLIKMDKDSHVLWTYSSGCHHSFDIGEDGTIYTLSYDFVKEVPPGLEYIPTPCVVDGVDVISPDGNLVKRIPLLEAFQDTPYAALLSTLEKPWLFRDVGSLGGVKGAAQDEMHRRDVLHTNAIQVLSRALAPKFPLFKPGQLLISSRHLDALVVLDPSSGKVVWGTHGPWHAQHDASFLDNGHLLLFDNLGSMRGSRVLEYDPNTQAFPWSYSDDAGFGKPFFSRTRGRTQRLPNGNTLIVSTDSGEMFEVTPSREVVWFVKCSDALNCARQYGPLQLPFLRGAPSARP
jgi:hypothetical protein